MSSVTINIHTGKIVKGEMPKIPASWLAENLIAPYIRSMIEEEKAKKAEILRNQADG